MSDPEAKGFDELLLNLETNLALLIGGTAPLDELVTAHERATRLVAQAEAMLAQLKARADETSQLLAE